MPASISAASDSHAADVRSANSVYFTGEERELRRQTRRLDSTNSWRTAHSGSPTEISATPKTRFLKQLFLSIPFLFVNAEGWREERGEEPDGKRTLKIDRNLFQLFLQNK